MAGSTEATALDLRWERIRPVFVMVCHYMAHFCTGTDEGIAEARNYIEKMDPNNATWWMDRYMIILNAISRDCIEIARDAREELESGGQMAAALGFDPDTQEIEEIYADRAEIHARFTKDISFWNWVSYRYRHMENSSLDDPSISSDVIASIEELKKTTTIPPRDPGPRPMIRARFRRRQLRDDGDQVEAEVEAEADPCS